MALLTSATSASEVSAAGPCTSGICCTLSRAPEAALSCPLREADFSPLDLPAVLFAALPDEVAATEAELLAPP
jgi:hypothetical protein